MEYIIFILSIVFWIVYYIFEGLHDVAFIKERDIIIEKVSKENYELIDPKVKHYEILWHRYDSFEEALVKIVFSIMIFMITENTLFALQILFLAVTVRMIMHDLVVALGLGKGLNHIGPSEDIWWDTFLRRMQKFGINQYLIKAIPLLAVLYWIIIKL